MIVLQCENMLDAEHMTWLVINHVTDLIQLSRESPVQDFIRWGRSYLPTSSEHYIIDHYINIVQFTHSGL